MSERDRAELLVDCAAPAGVLARALHDACGLGADDLLDVRAAREGTVVRIRGAARLGRGPVRLRVPLATGAVTVAVRRLDLPPRPSASRTLHLAPREQGPLPGVGAIARSLGLASEDVGAVAPWGAGIAVQVRRARLRPDLPSALDVDGRPWDVVTETRPARPLDAPLERFLRLHGAAGEAALAEALGRSLEGLPLDALPTALDEAAKKKSLTGAPSTG